MPVPIKEKMIINGGSDNIVVMQALPDATRSFHTLHFLSIYAHVVC